MVVVIVVLSISSYGKSDKKIWITEKVSKGDIKNSISASGSLAALTTVNVGSQISGNVLKLFADFNDRVTKGQLLAQIDDSTFLAKVKQATANLENATASLKNDIAQIKKLEASKITAFSQIKVQEANLVKAKVELEDAQRDQKRTKELAHRKLVSKAELDSANSNFFSKQASLKACEAQLDSSKAQITSIAAQIEAAKAQKEGSKARIKQMQALLDIAKIDLERTNIYSPIDGVVISREVDEGQTVAASLQAPKLFIIAQDMRKMQIETAVDEADIGMVKEGQEVVFDVDAFKDKKFTGKVNQVRLQPIETSNVVTYSVMVNVENSELLLKPGMTANVEIIIGNRQGVIRIPNKALFFKAPKFLTKRGKKRRDQESSDLVPVWLVSKNGKPVRKDIKVGLSNDSFVEVTAGDLNTNDLIIVGMDEGAAASRKSRRNNMLSPRNIKRTARRM